MKTLTAKQIELLKFLHTAIAETSVPPTVREIADRFGIKTSTVFAHLNALKQKGELTRTSKARSIVLTGEHDFYAEPEFNGTPVPLVTAEELLDSGSFLPPADDAAENSLPPQEKKCRNLFAFRVSDDALLQLGIYQNDLVIAARDAVPRFGDIVIAECNGKVVVRRYFPSRRGYCELNSTDGRSSVFKLLGDRTIFGVVLRLERNYWKSSGV